MQEVDVVVIGAGAAGVAAARRLMGAPLRVAVLEARDRPGGRAWTRRDRALGFDIDLGCGWLHSADENEWARIARDLGMTIDPTPPPWSRAAIEQGFPIAEQQDFRAALGRFYKRLDAAADIEPDQAAASLMEPGGRWNALINAVSSYVNGAELDRISIRDWGRYHDTEINRRVEGGYGALVAAYAAPLDVAFHCPVTRIDHSGRRLRLSTGHGDLIADAAIVTVPAAIIAREELRFAPALPEKIAAAEALPLGLADKVFLRVAAADDLSLQTRLFGAIDRTATGSYHLRPFGAPVIEGYFGGACARALEAEGDGAFTAFAIDEIVAQLGSDMRRRLSPLAETAWGRDRFARGSYSHARVGQADQRAALAAPVDDRIFFAGEAASLHDFSTAHGAYRTGVAAAEAALEAWSRRGFGGQSY
jgi:monoamine oxidase